MKTSEEIISRMMELKDQDYHCSRIMAVLGLERSGGSSPDLVRAMAGLEAGCGFTRETCGILTGASALIGWHAGKGRDGEADSDKLLPMLQELGEWFRKEAEGRFPSTRCRDIAGDKMGTPEGMQICGSLLFRTFSKLDGILTAYGL